MKFRSETSDNLDSWKSRGGKKEDAGARKGRKVAIHCVFPMICGSGGSKSRLARPAGAEPSGQMRDKKLHAVVGRSTCPSQNVQTRQHRTTFGSWDVEKVHAVVARSTFPSQKCKKNHTFGPLLHVQMSKKCTRLWREAHVQVKSVKSTTRSDHFWTSRCRRVHAVVARSTFGSQKCQKLEVLSLSLTFRCRKSAR